MLFTAQLVSNIGTWMQSVGAQWFLVEQAGSPALVAWVQTASTLPVLLLSLIAGVFADLVNRKRLLLVLTLVSAGVATALTVVTASGHLGPWGLLAFTFVLGCTAAVGGPAWQAIQPELVTREELPQASSLGSITVNGARAIGPAIAGVIVVASGPAAVFAANAASFLVVSLALLLWRRRTPPAPTTREHVLPGLLAGLRYVRAAPGVRRILVRCILFAFPACALWALLPSAAHDLMGADAAGYSSLLVLMGLGAIVGALLMGQVRRIMSGSAALAVSALVFGGATAAAALVSLPLMWPIAVVAGVAWIFSLTTLNVAIQVTLPGWVRARGLSVYLLVFMGSQAVGSFIWGLVAERISVASTLLVSAVMLMLVGLSVVVYPLIKVPGELGRTVSPLSDRPPEARSDAELPGPVVVAIRYSVDPIHEQDFVAAMGPVRSARLRTGARS